MLPEYFEFSLPTKLIYGIGILKDLGPAVERFGKRRAILVTDKVLLKAGPVEMVRKGFENTPIEIVCCYSNVPPNSAIRTVTNCARLARKHKCDMFIAVGGGSVIDTAKVANLLVVKGGRIQNHMGAYLLGADETLLPAIFIPTTAGTGSEVTKVAVIADPEKDLKLPFAEEQFLPQMAILDPEITVPMPGKLTATTGMDALTHAIEAYVDKEWSPASDGLALHAVRLITSHILQACAHPEDIQARGAMLVGSFLAGVAFSHSMVGMTHGISHALGGVYHIPHGLANALALPEVMEYNLDSRVERYYNVAAAIGVNLPQIVAQSTSVLKCDLRPEFVNKALDSLDFAKDWLDLQSFKVRGLAVKAMDNLSFLDQWFRRRAAMAGVQRIRTLNRQLAFLTGMPLNLRDAGIDDDLARLDQVVTTAMEDGSMIYNPRDPERAAVSRIIKKLFHAKVKPLPVSEEDLHPLETRAKRKEMKDVFKDSEMLYGVFLEFYELLKNDPRIGPALKKAHLCVQFVYTNPDAVITIDATKDDPRIVREAFDGRPEVTMAMSADFAHAFWHGKVKLVAALTRRQVTARGNLPKALKLLPILRPAYEMYPRFLREKGLGHLVMG